MSTIDLLGFTEESVKPENGWHCSHFFYSFDRALLTSMSQEEVKDAVVEFQTILAQPETQRIQSGIVSGHKADFSLMLMDPDPIKIEAVNQRLLNSQLGLAISPSWSYVSISEISEYVQSVEQYAARLQRSGESPGSEAFETKLKSYETRLEKMNVQRLTPEFPDWPVSCFYPMNKWRHVGANWYSLSSSQRNKLMGEHARSGIKFAGKVSQLITVGIGLDDWEWGVTLWAKNPKYLKEIVYDMRFDEASAKYAEFGPFYTCYKADAESIANLCLNGHH